ncbi:MAG: hypothetical protein IGS49_08785 [Chlorogloeopsis fritschii C42_A2020_084]|uniref:hypothetical protein n=1 Tax=Chlorogloeopsis fritschii TaxID=1124 RepID=UPI0019DB45F5|nr:hypothetical protein [Chlorogloeopsis fritschii]MBF2005549.1 hypothetical protein [Chlorogloeopsis fritschii C42_A2020_084]
MTTVYFWFGGDLKESFQNNLGAVGHVSLQYGPKATDYISFWPAEAKNKMQSWSVSSRFVSNYKEDCEEEIGRDADLKIEINGINKALIEAFWIQFKSSVHENREFNIHNRNCSSVVSKALIVGSRVKDKLEVKKGNWILDHIFDDSLLTLTTIVAYLEDQILRLVGIRSIQEHFVNMLERLVGVYPKFLKRTYLYTYVKHQDSIWWSPYHVAFFTILLKKVFYE